MNNKKSFYIFKDGNTTCKNICSWIEHFFYYAMFEIWKRLQAHITYIYHWMHKIIKHLWQEWILLLNTPVRILKLRTNIHLCNIFVAHTPVIYRYTHTDAGRQARTQVHTHKESTSSLHPQQHFIISLLYHSVRSWPSHRICQHIFQTSLPFVFQR